MAEFKLVLSKKDGKSSQKIVKDKEAEALLKKRIGEKVSGSEVGMEGYEFLITGGSDKCGFPMRKGILQKRQKIMIKEKGVGFRGKTRTKGKQKGLKRKKTVCGEMIDRGIVQVNMKVLKEKTSDSLGKDASHSTTPRAGRSSEGESSPLPKDLRQDVPPLAKGGSAPTKEEEKEKVKKEEGEAKEKEG